MVVIGYIMDGSVVGNPQLFLLYQDSNSVINMSNGGQDRKGGKVVYPARDARWQYGGPGLGTKPKPRSQSQARAVAPREVTKVKKIGGPDCFNCKGLCCTMS